jgi:hypothetical protein
MRTLSSSQTRTSKVTVPLVVVAATVACGAWVFWDDLASKPLSSCIWLLALVAVAMWTLWRSGRWRLADSVMEHEQGLRVRRGPVEILVPYSDIATVNHRAEVDMSVCVLELRHAGPFGKTIEFLPVTKGESMMLSPDDVWELLQKRVQDANVELASSPRR